MSKGTIIIDGGEVIENATYYTPQEQEQRKRFYETRQQMKIVTDKCKSYFKRYISGFNKLDDLDSQEATRLMYLATYTSYDDNILKYDNGVVLRKKDIYKIMNISDDACRNTLKKFIEKGYITETENGYQINKDIIHRGNNKEHKLDSNERYTRIFIQAMRKMYLSVKPTQHKLLGYVFQMLPYVNIYHNILCYNPYEKDIDAIQPINMIEFCRMLGLDDKNITRFRKNAEKVIFDFMGKKQHFMCYLLSAEDDNKNQGMIIINPNILYNEHEYNRVETIGLFYANDKISTKEKKSKSSE